MTEANKLVMAPLGITVCNDFVPIDYMMDPATEDLFRGSDLQEGMVVLIEDHMVREDPSNLNKEGMSPYSIRRIQEASRWCMITELQLGNIMSFIGVYGDGTKMSRMYSDRYFWLVKY